MENLSVVNVVMIASHLNTDSVVEDLANYFYYELKCLSLNRITQLISLHYFTAQESASFRYETYKDSVAEELSNDGFTENVDIFYFMEAELKKPRMLVDLGATQMSCATVYDGLLVKRSFRRVPLGVYHLVNYLGNFVSNNSYKISGDYDLCLKLFIETA